MNRRTPRFVLVVAVLAAAARPALAPSAEAPPGGEAALGRAARTFIEAFLAGERERYAGLMGAEMTAAFPPALADQVLRQILSMNGAVKKVGEAWMEDEVEAHRRFRVPTEFEKDTIDLRVVFDRAGKVVGFFQESHVPSPAEMAADETLRAKPNPAVEGGWEGAIEIPGAPLGVQVDLRYRDGYWIGTIDIPAQGARGLALAGVAVRDGDVSFAIAGVPGEPTFHGRFTTGAIAGRFTQSGQIFPFRLERGALARPARPQQPKPPFPYDEHEVGFTNGEVKLAGTLTVPRGPGPFPAALLLSGSGPQDRNEEIFDHRPFLVLADHLTRAGIAVLRVDDRGVGGSSGASAAATSADFASDAAAGVSFLRTREKIDPEKIGLIGHSEGAILAPMVAVKPGGVAWVVLLAGPGVPGSEIVVRQQELLARAGGLGEEQIAAIVTTQKKLLHLVEAGADEGVIRAALRELVQAQMGDEAPEEAIEQALSTAVVTVTSPWFRFFLTYDPRPALRELRVPVLALCGGKDLQVDPGQNLPEIRKALRQANNPDFTVEELESLNHLFQRAETGAVDEYYGIEETLNPAALEKISSWILTRFGGRSGE